MRFLKRKIQLSQSLREKKASLLKHSDSIPYVSSPIETDDSSSVFHEETQSQQSLNSQGMIFKSQLRSAPKENIVLPQSPKMKSCADTKNIAINYGKAIIRFAKSHLAEPYLHTYLATKSGELTMKDFSSFIQQVKNNITGIDKFRSLLLVTQEDNSKLAACKKTFQWICEVFLKFFSVNWIMHGKMDYKLVYLKYRSKMLRRVRNPEFFTFVRNEQRQKRAMREKQYLG